jgi:hypothetical protein
MASAAGGHSHGVELGVAYTGVPQPAGHHDTLWLHSQQVRHGASGAALEKAIGPDSWSPLWVNAQADDPADEQVSAAPMAGNLDAHRVHWYAELRPRLAVGLAFTDGTGQLSLPLRSLQGIEGATLRARVLVMGAGGSAGPGEAPYWGDPVLELASGEAAGLSLPAASAATAVVDLAGSGQRVPFRRDARFFLDLELEMPLPAAPTAATLPTLEPGGSIRLPLAEYGEPAGAGKLAGAADDDAGDGGPPLVVAGPGAETDAATTGLADGRESPAGVPAIVALGLAALAAMARRRLSRAA